MWPLFINREHAGQLLAAKLRRYKGVPNLLVLALPRGGVPVGFQVARSLGAQLDVFTVRKLGVPGQPELAMGAVATGGIRVLNSDTVRILRISDDVIDAVADREEQELYRREELYRHTHEPPAVKGLNVILVDDGIATGSSIVAAIKAIRSLGPARIIVAAPVAPEPTILALKTIADEVVVLETPEPFNGVGEWYKDFSQVSDEEVQFFLNLGRDREALEGQHEHLA